MYPSGYTAQLPPMGAHTGTAYAMAHPPGRSYRYYTGKPLFEFGQGLSYTTFALACTAPRLADGAYQLACEVRNTGTRDGDEVVQVYHAVGDAIRKAVTPVHPVPLKQLVGFERVSVKAGGSQPVDFSFPASAFSLTTHDGSRKVYPGGAPPLPAPAPSASAHARISEHRLAIATGVPGVEKTFSVAVNAA